MMYEGEEVMKMERIPNEETWFTFCCNFWRYNDNFRVYSPAENVIGYVDRQPNWIAFMGRLLWFNYFIMDENKEKIFDVIRNQNSSSGPVPRSVQRVSNKEVVAQIGRRSMMEPLGDIRPTPLQRWGARFLVPMPLKEKVLILAMTLYVDYSELPSAQTLAPVHHD